MSRSSGEFRYAFPAFALLLAAALGVGWSSERFEPGLLPGLTQLRGMAGPTLRRAPAVVRDLPLGVVLVAIFFSGMMLGWLSGVRWVGRYLRQRPLLIADLRSGDMPLADGVHHVRVNAFPPIADDDAAISLLLREAAGGRLTLWRRQRSGTLGRVSPLAARTAIARAGLISSVEKWRITHDSGFVLLSAEVERLWPGHNAKQKSAARIITTV